MEQNMATRKKSKRKCRKPGQYKRGGGRYAKKTCTPRRKARTRVCKDPGVVVRGVRVYGAAANAVRARRRKAKRSRS